MNEFLFLSVVFLFGWSLLHLLGLRGWGTVPAGFITGAFALVTIGFLFVVARFPTHPIWLVGAMLLITLACVLAGISRMGRKDMVSLVGGLAILGVLVFILREANLVKYHIDTFRYLLSSRLLVENQYGFASLNLLNKRMLVVPLLHAPAALYGEYYVRVFTPLLALSLLGFMVWLLRQGARVPADRARHLSYVTVLMVLLLLTNSRFIWNAFYLNAHLYFGIAFLAIAASSWLLATRPEVPRAPLYVLVALALPALVVARPEGFLAAGLALLPLLLSGSVSWRGRAALLAVYGVSMVLWHGHVALVHRSLDDGDMPLSTLGPLLMGVAMIVLIPTLAWTRFAYWRRGLLFVVEFALWLALAAFTFRDPEVMRASLDATYQNVVGGAGSWGGSLVVLTALLILAWVFCRDASLSWLRFPVTAMVPMFFLLAYLREGAYRVGNGDSLNRMLIEIVPLAVLFVAATAVSARWGLPGWRKRREITVTEGLNISPSVDTGRAS